MDKNTERDTHFQGFAKLLMTELLGDAGYIDVHKFWDKEEIADMEQIITQRAYDLACHVLYETSYGMDKWDITGRVNVTRDITEWPPIPPEP